MLAEFFSDTFARRTNRLTLIDPRIKMVFTLAAILFAVTARSWLMPLTITLLALLVLTGLRVPLKILTGRLSAPLGIAGTVFFVKFFFFGQTLPEAALAMLKVTASTSLVLFLSMTTSLDKLLAAASWFRMPREWIEVCLLTYRYIFVLLEDATAVLNAQKVRLGYAHLRSALRSVGTLSGAIIIRAYDQSIATYHAMMLRGYTGRMHPNELEKRAGLENALDAGIFASVLVLLVVLNQWGPRS